VISQESKPLAAQNGTKLLTPCHPTRNRSGASRVRPFTGMAVSTCLPLHSSLRDTEFCEGQRQLRCPLSSIHRHEASQTTTPPKYSVVGQLSESRTTSNCRSSHNASSAEEGPQLSRKSVRQAEGGMQQDAKARPCGESDFGRPKIDLSTSNGGAFGIVAESSSSSSPSRYAEFKVANLEKV
jgi:hypothetical protein